jgi:hypothetical protein
MVFSGTAVRSILFTSVRMVGVRRSGGFTRGRRSSRGRRCGPFSSPPFEWWGSGDQPRSVHRLFETFLLAVCPSFLMALSYRDSLTSVKSFVKISGTIIYWLLSVLDFLFAPLIECLPSGRNGRLFSVYQCRSEVHCLAILAS